jgi:hypothetical protein
VQHEARLISLLLGVGVPLMGEVLLAALPGFGAKLVVRAHGRARKRGRRMGGLPEPYAHLYLDRDPGAFLPPKSFPTTASGPRRPLLIVVDGARGCQRS